MQTSLIAKSSPLFEYWSSNQNDKDEEARLLIANNKSKAVYLFNEEPYKWEILYQISIREIVKGDVSYIKSLRILLDTLNYEEVIKVTNYFKDKNILSSDIIEIINSNNIEYDLRRKTSIAFLKTLFVIFFNPYGIEMKRKRKHLYEITGVICFSCQKLLKNYFSWERM